MKIFSTAKIFLALVLLLALAACFKNEVMVVGSPDDVAGDSITTPPAGTQIIHKVLVIGIDGCRGDAMRTANAPNIHGLLPHAIYSFDALTQAPTTDGSGWASMLTGVWSDKNGVKDNSFSGSNFTQYPMIFRYIKQFNPQAHTVSICSWDPINDYIVSGADVKINTNDDDVAVKDSAVARLKNDNPDVMFLNFDGVNQAGDQFGYDTTVPAYMQSISKVDGYVGEILQALNARPNVANEDWLIILSSDHGGNANGHGSDSYEEKNIFTVFYNKQFASKEIVPPPSTLKVLHFQYNGDYASVENSTDDGFLDFDSYTKFTAQIEVKSSKLAADDPFLTNKNWNSGGNTGWVMAVQGQSWKFNAGDGSHRVDVNAGGPALSDGQWHSIAITVDKNSKEVKLYQDGALLTYSSIATITKWSPTSDVKLVTGDDITGNYRESWGNSPFSMANIRIWDTVISEQDMKQYGLLCDTTGSVANSYQNNLVGWWRAIEGAGNDLQDFGPNKRNMKVSGATTWVQQQIDLCNTPLPPSVPSTVDVAPMVLDWLGITVDPGWGLDGVSWLP